MHKKSLVEEMFKNKSKNTIKNYRATVHKYEQFHDTSIEELVQEALAEQSARVPEHELKIYNRIIDFQDYLIAEGYVYKTIVLMVNRIRTIYRRSRVTLPYFPPLDAKHIKRNDFIEYHEVITKDEIRLALPYFKKNFQARIMLMATGGYSLEETRTLTVKQFLEELYPYHKSHDPNKAMKKIAAQDNIIWVAKMLRVKTQKPYYGMCNPETTQAIAKSWIDRNITDIDIPLFRQNKNWVSNHMGKINDMLGFGKAGGFRRFTPHTLRRFNATNLSGADLTSEEQMKVRMIDELQGRSMTDTQDRYIKTNPIKQKLLYAKVMNNVSLFNQYTYEIFDGEVVIHRVDPQKKIRNLADENKKLKEEVKYQQNADNELKKYIQSVGKDTFEERLSKLLSEL